MMLQFLFLQHCHSPPQRLVKTGLNGGAHSSDNAHSTTTAAGSPTLSTATSEVATRYVVGGGSGFAQVQRR